MTWKVSDDPVDFDAAIVWFRKRVAISKAEFNRLGAKSKRKAFAVANVAQADVINQVFSSIDSALKSGLSFADWKSTIGPELRKAWGGKVDDPAWRLETIFRTNLALAYGAGRHNQASHPDVIEDRPIWMFDAILDGRESDICHACDGTTLPADHPWWRAHTPPLHHSCRSGFIAQTPKQSKITLHPPTSKPDKGFGLAPADDEWEPDTSKYPKALRQALEKKLEAAPPPPPPAKLVEGVHIQEVKRDKGISKDVENDLLDAVTEAETLQFLEKHPLAHLALREQARSGGDAVNGFYNIAKHFIEVTADRGASTFNEPFVAGSSFSLSSVQTSKEAASKATIRHELGHHVHLVDGRGSDTDKLVREAYARARKAKTFITRYAQSAYEEYFAESYAAYYLRRSTLKSFDPNGFKMVEDVLRARGILP